MLFMKDHVKTCLWSIDTIVRRELNFKVMCWRFTYVSSINASFTFLHAFYSFSLQCDAMMKYLFTGN